MLFLTLFFVFVDSFQQPSDFFASHKGNVTNSCRRSNAGRNIAQYYCNHYKDYASKKERQRFNKRDNRIVNLSMILPDFDKAVACDKHTYFIANDVKDGIIPDGSTKINVSDLKVVDSFDGAELPGVFTLLPRSSVSRIMNKYTFNALACMESCGSDNSRDGVERRTLFETKGKYITFGANASRFQPGVHQTIHHMEGHDLEYKEISRYCRQVETVAKSYIYSAEVVGMYEAKFLLDWKTIISNGSKHEDL